MKFYFFKVTLRYFDDTQKEFFITPDQSETDEEGVPFSEINLRNTPEFKEFVKKNKADIIDVDYTEYAAEYDPKHSELLSEPIGADSFSGLEKGGKLSVVEENQFLISLKALPKGKNSSKLPVVCVMIAGVIVLGMFAYGELNKRGKKETSSSPEVSETSLTERISDESFDDISSTPDESDRSNENSKPNVSSANVENTHEPTSDTDVTSSENNSDNSSSGDSNNVSEAPKYPTATVNIFELTEPADMAVIIAYNGEKPSASFIAPNGETLNETELITENENGIARWYIPNAMAGQWQICYDIIPKQTVNLNWEQQSAPTVSEMSEDLPPLSTNEP